MRMILATLALALGALPVASTRHAAPATVTDPRSGLTWSREDLRAQTGAFADDWSEAMAWAERMNRARLGGHADWRVASVAEYRTLRRAGSVGPRLASGGEDFLWARDEPGRSVDVRDGAAPGERPRFSARLVRRAR